MFTRSEFQGEFLRLDLGDLLRFQFLSPVLANRDWSVLVDGDASTRVFNLFTFSFLQGLQVVTTG